MASSTQLHDDAEVPDLVSDCRLMLRYARKNAFDLSPELVSETARLDAFLKQRGFDPVCDINIALVSGTAPLSEDISSVSIGSTASSTVAQEMSVADVEGMILKVHGELCKVIAPATALTLQASEPPPGKHRFLGGMPLIVKAAAFAALVSAGAFVASAGAIAQKAADANKAIAAKKEAEEANKKKAAETQRALVEARAPSAPVVNEKGAKQ